MTFGTNGIINIYGMAILASGIMVLGSISAFDGWVGAGITGTPIYGCVALGTIRTKCTCMECWINMA